MWGLLRVTLLNSKRRTEAALQQDRGCAGHTVMAHTSLGHAALPVGPLPSSAPNPKLGPPTPSSAAVRGFPCWAFPMPY